MTTQVDSRGHVTGSGLMALLAASATTAPAGFWSRAPTRLMRGHRSQIGVAVLRSKPTDLCDSETTIEKDAVTFVEMDELDRLRWRPWHAVLVLAVGAALIGAVIVVVRALGREAATERRLRRLDHGADNGVLRAYDPGADADDHAEDEHDASDDHRGARPVDTSRRLPG